MKNNRPIEVGQVRQVTCKKEVSFGALYFIDSITEMDCGYTFCEVTFINGTRNGSTEGWDVSDAKQDIVVM